MLSLEREIRGLHDEGLVEDDAARTLIALERRDLFSVHAEIRFLFWAAVSLIGASAALFLREYADRIGHAAIIGVIALAAVACYGLAWRLRGREIARGDTAAIGVSEYVLLLAALLLSADVAYAETQYQLLAGNWSRHLLLLAVVHGLVAYRFESRLVLGLSIASMIGWLGIERDVDFLFRSSWFVGERLIGAALVLIVWRALHGRLIVNVEPKRRARLETFNEVFEHLAANLGMLGALRWIFSDAMEWSGCLVMCALVAGSVIVGIRTRREAFVVYGFLYGVVAFDVMVLRHLNDDGLIFFYLLVTTPIAIVALFLVHRRWRLE